MNFESIKIGPNDLQQVLDEYTDSIIIAVSPSCNIEQKKGCQSTTEIVVEGGGASLAAICK